MYNFDLEDYAGTYRVACKTLDELNTLRSTIIKNDDGTVEIFYANGLPYENIKNKQCCEILGYNFNIENQKCYWNTPSSSICGDDCTKKIVFNSNKNKGSLFKINENEKCGLDISFDYLINFNCEVFNSVCPNDDITKLQDELKKLKTEYNKIYADATFNSNLINQTQISFDNLQYVIKGTYTKTSRDTTTRGYNVNQENNTTTTTTSVTSGVQPITSDVYTGTDNVQTTTNITTTTRTEKPEPINTWGGSTLTYTYGDTTTNTNNTTNENQTTVDYTSPVEISYDNNYTPSINTNLYPQSTFINEKEYNVILPLGLDYTSLNFKYTAEVQPSNTQNDLPPSLFGFYLYGKKASATYTTNTNTLLPKIFLLTNSGLAEWAKILGEDAYKKYIDNYGCDESLYTPTQFNDYIDLISNTVYSNGTLISDYYSETTQGVCDKKLKKDELNKYKLIDNQYKLKLSELQTKINETTSQLNFLKSKSPYVESLKNIENINIKFILENNTGNGKYTNIYEETLFNIGEGNMVNFINDKAPNTGILISGATSNGILIPPYSFPVLNDGDYVRFDCDANRDEFIKTLYLERYKGNFPEPTTNEEQIELNKKLNSWYNSTWVNYNISIPENIINKIKDTEIRFSIMVESCCVDLCFLIDKINFNKHCEELDNQEIVVSKPPSFELERVMDNKKSWSVGDDETSREYDLTFRETQYNAEDHRLILNTKEIELKIDGSNAIEEDMLCSIQKNMCLLTGMTFTNETIEGAITTVNIDNVIDFQTIILESTDLDYESIYVNSVSFNWTATVTNNCNELYEIVFNEGEGTSIVDMIPTNEMYKTVLEDLANKLDVQLVHNGSITTLTDINDNKSLINGLYIDIKLNMTLDYYELFDCYQDVFNIISYSDAIESGIIPFPVNPEDLFSTAREVRNAWLRAWNSLMLASGAYLDIENGIPHPNPSEDVMETYNATRTAYLSALSQFNLASGGGYIEGLTIEGQFNDYTESIEYINETYTNNGKIAPQMFSTKCGRIFKRVNSGDGYLYFVETPTKELKVFWAFEDYGPRNTTWIDITSIVQEDYPENWYESPKTAEKASFWCKFLMPNNYTTWIDMMSFHYKTNGDTSHNQWVNPVENDFFIDWDDEKGKCMTNMFEQVVPEQFSMSYPIKSLNFWTNYGTLTTEQHHTSTPQCVLDIYLRNSGSTECVSCCNIDFTWPNIAAEIDGVYRTYRNAVKKLQNEIKLTERTPSYYIFLIDPATNLLPDESGGQIPVKVTTTIRKDSHNGDIVFKEEYVLNDSGATCSYRYSLGLDKLSVYVGMTDPNSAYWNVNAANYDLTVGCTIGDAGTLLSGSTSGLPIPGASDNGVDRNWRFDENYYVHFDVVNNNTGYVYEVTNNDFNLKDKPLPIVCPSSASTQTFDINTALTSINTHKTKMLSNIQEDLDWALNNCTDC